jgi:hypothetical protein
VFKSNKDALRWCKNHRVIIEFFDSGDSVRCCVSFKKIKESGNTLINAVNLIVARLEDKGG